MKRKWAFEYLRVGAFCILTAARVTVVQVSAAQLPGISAQGSPMSL
jgi:hypothetical protein